MGSSCALEKTPWAKDAACEEALGTSSAQPFGTLQVQSVGYIKTGWEGQARHIGKGHWKAFGFSTHEKLLKIQDKYIHQRKVCLIYLHLK